jgi:hypothetical protein
MTRSEVPGSTVSVNLDWLSAFFLPSEKAQGLCMRQNSLDGNPKDL